VTPPPAVHARDVAVTAGRATLIAGVSLDVLAGEVVALVGPNGAGKSTLLAVLAGDRRPDRGDVRLAGRPVSGQSSRDLARRRAVLPQRAGLAAGFTALEVVMLGQDGGLPRDRARAARRRLAAVDLAAFADRLYPTLSGGEQQRVQLARVLEQLGDDGGRALFLDEPTASLDPRHQHLVLALARRAAAAGHAVVVVLHDLNLAARHADRIAVLDHGQLATVGAPRHALCPDLLRDVFAIDVDVVTAPDGHSFVIVSPRGGRRGSDRAA